MTDGHSRSYSEPEAFEIPSSPSPIFLECPSPIGDSITIKSSFVREQILAFDKVYDFPGNHRRKGRFVEIPSSERRNRLAQDVSAKCACQSTNHKKRILKSVSTQGAVQLKSRKFYRKDFFKNITTTQNIVERCSKTTIEKIVSRKQPSVKVPRVDVRLPRAVGQATESSLRRKFDCHDKKHLKGIIERHNASRKGNSGPKKTWESGVMEPRVSSAGVREVKRICDGERGKKEK